MCYFFQNTSGGVEVQKLYSDMTLEVRDVRELTAASPGDVENAVVGMEKTITFGGFGILEGDKVKWAIGTENPGKSDCSGTTAPMIGSGEVTVNYKSEATFKFTEPSFAGNIEEGRIFVELCYKHADEPYQHHNLTMELHMIRSYQTFSGDRRTAVSGIPERLNYRGFGLSRYDRHYWTSTYCTGRRRPYLGLNVTNRETHRYLNTTTTFDDQYLGSTLFLCWAFRDEGYHMYENFTIKIAGVGSLEAAAGDSDVAVLGATKTISFVGSFLQAGDAARWVSICVCEHARAHTNMSTFRANWFSLFTSGRAQVLGKDCSRKEYENHTFVEGPGIHNQNVTADFLFTETELAGRNLTLCYKHSIDPQSPYKLYDKFILVVKTLTGMNGTLGSDTKAVAMLEKGFNFRGEGVADGDQVRFITDASENCEDDGETSPLAKLYKSNGGDAFTAKLSSRLQVDLIFRIPFYNKVRLCYKHGNEPYYLYGNVSDAFKMSVVGIEDVRSRSGGPDTAVCSVPKKLSFHGPGVSVGDDVRWTVGDDCESLNDALLFNQTNGSWTGKTANLALNKTSVTMSTFHFNPALRGERPKLCYRFYGEEWQLYSAFRLKLAYLSGDVSVSNGADDVAVAQYAKKWKFGGSYTSEGDKAKWIEGGGCDNTTARLLSNGIDGDTKSYSFVSSDKYATFNSSIDNAGRKFTLCYAFADEPWLEYPSIGLEVKHLTSMESSYSAKDVVVAGMAKEFHFSGEGLENADEVRWVNGTADSSCNDASLKIADSTVDVDKDQDYLVASDVLFSEKKAGGPFSTCFKFGNEPYKVYNNLRLEVVTVTSVSTDLGDPEVLVEDDPKVLHFDGSGITKGDVVAWIPLADATSDDACATDAGLPVLAKGTVDDHGNVTVIANPDVVGEYTADKDWALCYTHRSEPPKAYTSLTLRLRRLYSVSVLGANATGTTLSAVVGIEKSFHVVADGLDTPALAIWTSSQLGCNEEISPAGGILDPSFVSTAGTMSFTFASPTTPGSTFGLCFKFDGEPWRFYHSIEIQVNQVTGVSTAAILKNVPQIVFFLGFGVTTTPGLYGYDKAAWVPSGSSCDSSEVTDAAESVVSSSATFVFSDDTELSLCYRFAQERTFVAYEEISVEVTDAVIDAATYNAVVGVATSLNFVGSFGVVSGDSLQWVENSATNCSAAMRADYAVGGGEYSATSTTFGGEETPYTGLAVYDFTFESTSEESSPWKLCYKFGEGDFVRYSGVELFVREVTAVVMDEAAVLELETPISFTFYGTGLEDGDRAILVDETVASDAECDALGKTPGYQIIASREATFTFNAPIASIALCYRFLSSSNYKYYSGVASVTSAEAESLEELVAAEVTITLDIDFSTIPEGSPARDTFEESFKSDVSSALGIPSYRLNIIDIYSGSIVVVFEITPATDGEEEASAVELAETFVEQAADPTSALFEGNITSSTTGITFVAITQTGDAILNATETDTISAASNTIRILAYQANGLFLFSKAEHYTTERSGSVQLRVVRQQGTFSTVKLSWKTTDGTAKGGSDYVAASGVLTFLPGVTEQNVTIDLIDDDAFEAAYETLSVSISVVPDLLLVGAAIGSVGTTTVRIFDYGDGSLLFYKKDFTSPGGLHNRSAGSWDVVGNGVESGAWVDKFGLAASDRIYGPNEYSQECDLAATEACDHSCKYGGGYAETNPLLGESPSVLAMNGQGYIATRVSNFPTTEASFVAWVRTTTRETAGAIFSYVTKSGLHEFLLYNPESLSLMIHDQIVDAGARYDGPEGGDRRGFRTGVSITDGAWHHVAITWRSADGEVTCYIDGIRRFQGAGYRTGKSLAQAGGTVVLGNMQTAPCTFDSDGTPTCSFGKGRGFVGQIQNVRVFDKILKGVDVLGELRWPITSSPTASAIYWRFALESVATTSLPAYYATDLSENGNDAWISHTGVQVQSGTPSINPNYPCGEVYSGIWHFRTPMGSTLADAYGSRVQFAMYSPSFDGNIREARGTVVLKGNTTSKELSFTSHFDTPSSGGYTYMSALLKASTGMWLVEPLGTMATTQDLRDVLSDSPELLLRGDTHVYGDDGFGMEVVYLKEVQVWAGA